MSILDRYIIVRFLASFAILFALLYLFAVAIDVILNLDGFVEAAKGGAGQESATGGFLLRLAGTIFGFQAPRAFQFFAYLHGLVAVGAMAFTLAQMHRHKELVAVMAAGLSLHRVAVPFVALVFVFGAVQLLNQELILPRIAPLLLRHHRDIGQRTVAGFPVPLTPDRNGSLFQSPSFEPASNTMQAPTIIERDTQGRTTRRITASSARWVAPSGTAERGGWQLADGQATTPLRAPDAPLPEEPAETLIDFYPTDLGPDALTARRYGEYMTMLSLGQIGSMLETPGYGDQKTVRSLLRLRYARFASVLITLLVFVLALPSFLLRAPSNMLWRCIECAALSIPATIGAGMLMMVDLGGIAPAVSVFLPVAILGPLALARWTYLAT